jgi:hypothetical protein
MQPPEEQEGEDTHPILEMFAVIAIVMAAIFNAYLYFCRPAQWQALKREKAQKLAEAEASKAKDGILIRSVTKGGDK